MKLPLLLMLLLAAILPALCEGESKDTLPTYVCAHIDKEMNLTGKLDDPLWEKAQVVRLVDAVDGRETAYKTTVQLLWSQKYLYVGFNSEDEYIWGTLTKHDDPIYNEEVVEIFVSPTGLTRQYYEIEVSPLGTLFDAYILNGKNAGDDFQKMNLLTDYDFKGLKRKISIDGEFGKTGAKGWKMEMAIPFSGLLGPDNIVPIVGDSWRMNLYRIDMKYKAGFPSYFAWSPTKIIDFHTPWNFGYLKFDK